MDERTIRRWFDVFKSGGELTEVRIMPPGGKGMYSGYFTDVETLLSAVRPYGRCNVYWTLNRVNPACYSREQRDRISERPKVTTSDSDIVGRDYVLIDIDPARPAETSASDAELAGAKEVANRVFAFLRDEGFNLPATCLSGNGVHLLLKCGLDNTPENAELVKDFLAVLDMLFSTEAAKVDTTTHNASRICKLYGTRARKGSPDDPERPHRMSGIVSVPDPFRDTDRAYFGKVAAMLPKPEAPNRYTGYSGEPFDLDGFIREHGIAVAKVSRFGGGTKYVLERCPFDANHTAPDAALFRMDSGAIGFRCLHNSCSNYHWRDFRLFYEPDAYERRDRFESLRKREYYSRGPRREFRAAPEDGAKGKKWLSMADIRWVDPSKLPHVPTGLEALDRRMMGLMMGDVTVLSGLSGAGKTSLINTMALNAVQRGYRVAVWSGELQDFRFQSWIDQAAAGKNHVRPKAGYEGLYFAPRDVCEKINRWLEGKLWLYNNGAYGSKWGQVFPDIRECVEKNGANLIVLDNLMALDIDLYPGERNDRQSAFINDVKDYAKKAGVHVLPVCHPRKEQSFQLLRMESISGTADLTNLADNVLICHRRGRDFERRATDFFGMERVQEMLGYDMVIEVAKNRSAGVKDLLVGLYYEQESRRLKNSMAENIIYGWQEDGATGSLDFVGDLDDLPEF